MAEHREDVADMKPSAVMAEKDEEHFVDTNDVLKGAQKATNGEHVMSLRAGIRKYPMAAFWSFWFSTALIMEGFDHAFINGFMAFPPFQERYGVLQDGDYQIPADLQAGVSNGVSAGQIIGLIINGFVADWFGYRKVMIASLFLMSCFIFLQFFALDIYMYLGAEVLLGVPWGVFQTLTTTYAAEVCPNVLRPYLTMMVSLCWSLGYLIGTGTLRGFLEVKGSLAYKLPFALQWVLPVPLAIGIYLAPESPWWLVRVGRTEDAGKALRRLGSKEVSEEEVADTLSMMVHTVKIEKEMKTSSSYWDLFKGVNLRRTEIVVFVYVIQELCAPLVSRAVYFLEEAGISSEASFDFGMGEYALAIVAVFIAWFLAPKIGRRALLLSGTAFMTVTTLIIGFVGIPDPTTHKNIAYAIGSILLVEYFVFFITLGPIIYTIVAEVPSNFLRTKSVALARAAYNVNALIYGQLIPRMLQNDTWGWGAKSGFFFGGLMAFSFIWAYFRVPETKNRTFAEMDILFKNKISARDFSKARVDLAAQTVEL